MLREEGIDAVRHVLWDATSRHQDYDSLAWRNRAPEEQKRTGWAMAVRIEKILCTILHEAHERQVEEVVETLSVGPEDFYNSPYRRDIGRSVRSPLLKGPFWA